MSWESIIEGNGFGITLVGMLIVFTGLVLVSLYISSLPRILNAMQRSRERREQRGAVTAKQPEDAALTDEQALIAAIGYVIEAEIELGNLLDYQRITIQRDESQRIWAVAGKMRTLSTRM